MRIIAILLTTLAFTGSASAETRDPNLVTHELVTWGVDHARTFRARSCFSVPREGNLLPTEFCRSRFNSVTLTTDISLKEHPGAIDWHVCRMRYSYNGFATPLEITPLCTGKVHDWMESVTYTEHVQLFTEALTIVKRIISDTATVSRRPTN